MPFYSIHLFTTSRADFSLVQPLALELSKLETVEATLVYTGSHRPFKPRPSSLNINLKEVYLPCDNLGKSIYDSSCALSSITLSLSSFWKSNIPDIIYLAGDRFELLPILNLAILNGIPIAHSFGGEVSISCCLDTQVRDSITKAAHIHFVSHPHAKKRLQYLGEESWRIFVSGNPSLDNINITPAFLEYATLQRWNLDRIITACYLPPTTNRHVALIELKEIFNSLESYSDYIIIWAGVNSDPGSSEILKAINEFSQRFPNNIFIDGLGREKFHGLLSASKFMIGNSSSGLLEAASFGLPVINVGCRQTGRLCPPNVINVKADSTEINMAIKRSLASKDFRSDDLHPDNPFSYKGKSASMFMASTIVKLLSMGKEALMTKKYVEDDLDPNDSISIVPEYS